MEKRLVNCPSHSIFRRLSTAVALWLYTYIGSTKIGTITNICWHFPPSKKSHTWLHLAETFLKILDDYGIDRKRVLAITNDNASNNERMNKDINERIERDLQDMFKILMNTFKKAKVIRVPCMAHIIQLGLKEIYLKVRINMKDKDFVLMWTSWDNSHETKKLEKLKDESKGHYRKEAAGRKKTVRPTALEGSPQITLAKV